MLSREMRIHVAAVAIGLIVIALLEFGLVGPDSGLAPVWAFLVFYGLVLGGAHLYLAIRGEAGTVPVASRWRYLAALAVFLVAGAAILYGDEYTVASIGVDAIGIAILVAAIVAYLVAEAIAGYRATRPE